MSNKRIYRKGLSAYEKEQAKKALAWKKPEPVNLKERHRQLDRDMVRRALEALNAELVEAIKALRNS